MITTVLIHQEDNSWWAESPHVPGWTAVASTATELMTLVGEALDLNFLEETHG